MSELRPVVLSGRTVWIESDEVPASAPVVAAPAASGANHPALTRTSAGSGPAAPTATTAAVAEMAQIGPTLEAVLEPIKASCRTLPSLSEVTVEVSLGFKGSVGFFVAKGEANGAVKVAVKWSPGKD
jgi:hypothetical protein